MRASLPPMSASLPLLRPAVARSGSSHERRSRARRWGHWAARGPDRAGGQCIADAGEGCAVRFEGRLPAHQIVELLLELLLIEQLPAGCAIDACAQFGDAVLVCALQIGLPRDQALEEIVAESKIRRGCDRPAGHDHDGADKNPER